MDWNHKSRLHKFNPKTQTFTRRNLPYELETRFSKQKIWIRKIFVDDRDHVWVGTTAGLYRFNALGKNVKTYQRKDSIGSIAGSSIMDMVSDKRNRLWIATQSGLSLFDSTTQSFINFFRSDSDPNSISNDYVDNLIIDQQGNIWLGTGGGGLNKLKPDASLFKYYGLNRQIQEWCQHSSNEHPGRRSRWHCLDWRTSRKLSKI